MQNTPLKLLIIEDEDDAVLLLLRELASSYPQIEHKMVYSQADLVQALNTNSWDVVTCDFQMPQLDPMNVLALVREYDENIPFLLVSGEITDSNAIALMKAGAQDYINKNRLAFLPIAIERELKESAARRAKKQSEEQLRISEKRFRDFAESSSDWFWESNADGKFTYISKRFFELSGWQSSDIYGFEHKDFINQNEDINSLKWQQHLATIKAGKSFKHVEYQLMKKNGATMFVSINGIAVFNSKGKFAGYRGTGTDVTESKLAQIKLNQQAKTDALTGLINRHEFEQRANRLLSMNQHSKSEHAMCFMDLDQFKIINDTCGHPAGDELLRQLGKLLQTTVRNRDTLARLGGDEFGILMEHCALEKAHRVADAILKTIQDYQFIWQGEAYRIGVSIGLVAITEHTRDFTELLKQADAACYLAKDLGRNRIHKYHPEDTELANRHGEMQWVGRIRQALENNQFCLYAQPIVSLNDGTLTHYEILLRMHDNNGHIISPGAFLPAAERYNLIEDIDNWMVNHTCLFLAKHPHFVEKIEFISINLSGPSLTNKNFLQSIITLFKETRFPPEKICFEITETVAISNLQSASEFITTLKQEGCHFAMDDFGSGLSSFGYLKNLPVDYLKIDGMFVRDIVDDPIDFAMVKSINDIGHVMGMKTIAEFVENNAIKNMLGSIHVDYAQGYGLGKPQPLNDLVSSKY